MAITECPQCGWNNLELLLGGGEARFICPHCGCTGDYFKPEGDK